VCVCLCVRVFSALLLSIENNIIRQLQHNKRVIDLTYKNFLYFSYNRIIVLSQSFLHSLLEMRFLNANINLSSHTCLLFRPSDCELNEGYECANVGLLMQIAESKFELCQSSYYSTRTLFGGRLQS